MQGVVALTTTERLREAAKVLRDVSLREQGDWPCDEWTEDAVRHIARNCDIECGCPHPEGGWVRYQTADFIKTMHPGVGLALADWLDDLADHDASDLMPMERGAYAVADCVLRDGGS